jgi:hypothetical protein
MHRLEFHRGTIPQGSVQPFLIAHILDEVGKSPLDILHRLILPEIDLLGLECFHEALGHSVVARITFAGHTDPERIPPQDVHILMGGILHSPVRVMDDSRRRISSLESHLKGCKAQIRVDLIRKGITDGLAGIEVRNKVMSGI